MVPLEVCIHVPVVVLLKGFNLLNFSLYVLPCMPVRVYYVEVKLFLGNSCVHFERVHLNSCVHCSL